MSRSHSSGARPKLACEVSSERVLAGRAADLSSSIEFASHNLVSGKIVPDLTEPNIRDRDAVSQTIHDALGGVGGRSRDVIAILPDAAVRVVLLDFETLPTKPDEAAGVVRFRLKKSMPFDVEKAKISYHAYASNGNVRVVAAVALASVVEEYESAFLEAGYTPGVVLPSMLAALGAAQGSRPTLVLKVDARTTSIAILDKEQVLLFRTLENAHGTAISGDRLAEEVYPSVVFFQDTYHMNIERIYVAGLPDLAAAAPALRAQTNAEVQDLVGGAQMPASRAIPRWQAAGVVGALTA